MNNQSYIGNFLKKLAGANQLLFCLCSLHLKSSKASFNFKMMVFIIQSFHMINYITQINTSKKS
jgi:hypothetical protein